MMNAFQNKQRTTSDQQRATSNQQPGTSVGFILKGYPRLSETFILNEILLPEQMGLKLHIFALLNPCEARVHDKVRQVRAGVTYIPDCFWPYFWAFIKANVLLWRSRPALYRQALRFAVTMSMRHWSTSTIKRFMQAAYLVQNHLPPPGGASAPLYGVPKSGTKVRLTGKNDRREGRVAVSHFHAHFSHGPTTVAFFASWLTDLHYSFSAHAKDIYLQKRDFLRHKLLHASFVVTCTEFNRNYLQQVAGKEAIIQRCYHGIDLKAFTVPPIRLFHAPPNILSIGRLVPKKGFPILLQALHFLRRGGYQFRCIIIGDGPIKNELRQQIAQLRLNDCVKLLPPMPQSDLLEYYHHADLFALACEVQEDGDRDGIPNVVVEAMAMGLPIVSTRISGIPECVADGVTGLLVAEKDPLALAVAMALLLGEPEWAQQLGRAGRKKVECDFNARRNVEQIAAALQKATASYSSNKTARLRPWSLAVDTAMAANKVFR
jgi:glycosyltransferase involved in cell wall biosynthesis